MKYSMAIPFVAFSLLLVMACGAPNSPEAQDAEKAKTISLPSIEAPLFDAVEWRGETTSVLQSQSSGLLWESRDRIRLQRADWQTAVTRRSTPLPAMVLTIRPQPAGLQKAGLCRGFIQDIRSQDRVLGPWFPMASEENTWVVSLANPSLASLWNQLSAFQQLFLECVAKQDHVLYRGHLTFKELILSYESPVVAKQAGVNGGTTVTFELGRLRPQDRLREQIQGRYQEPAIFVGWLDLETSDVPRPEQARWTRLESGQQLVVQLPAGKRGYYWWGPPDLRCMNSNPCSAQELDSELQWLGHETI